MGLNQYNTTTGELKEGMLFLNQSIHLYGGTGILFDNDGDTKISATTANKLDFTISGALDFWMTSNMLVAEADSAFGGASGNIVPQYPIASEQRISGDGAATLTEKVTKWTTTSADAGTLADGEQYGQVKVIMLLVDGGDLTLTPANFGAFTDVTFEDAGDWIELQWNGSDWIVINTGNTVDGISEPTVA